MPRTIISFSEPYFGAAREELSARFAGAKIERLGAEVGSIETAGGSIGDTGDIGDIGEVAAACRSHQVVFVRHLIREQRRLPLADVTDDPDLAADTIVELLRAPDRPRQLALQIWADESSPADNTLVQRILKRSIAGLTEPRFHRHTGQSGTDAIGMSDRTARFDRAEPPRRLTGRLAGGPGASRPAAARKLRARSSSWKKRSRFSISHFRRAALPSTLAPAPAGGPGSCASVG